MKASDNRKYFEFMKYFFHDPLTIDYIQLYQIGEVMLEDGGSIHSHVQECCEISYVLSGRGVFVCDGNEVTVSHGDIHLMSTGSFHDIRSDSPEGFRFAYLGFRFIDSHTPDDMKDIYDFFENCPYHAIKDNGDILLLFRMLINEWYNEPEHSNITTAAMIKCIIVLVERLFNAGAGKAYMPQKNDASVGRSVYNILQYIDNNAIDITGVRMIAQKFGYAENYISHLFKSKTGLSIQRYIINAKLKIAREMLESSQCSITEISERLKYSSPQSFCKMFRKNMGCTPSQYRTQTEQK